MASLLSLSFCPMVGKGTKSPSNPETELSITER